jgi:hypothetical protein
MSDNELSQQSDLSLLTMSNQARTKPLDRSAATRRGQASLLHNTTCEVPERI